MNSKKYKPKNGSDIDHIDIPPCQALASTCGFVSVVNNLFNLKQYIANCNTYCVPRYCARKTRLTNTSNDQAAVTEHYLQ